MSLERQSTVPREACRKSRRQRSRHSCEMALFARLEESLDIWGQERCLSVAEETTFEGMIARQLGAGEGPALLNSHAERWTLQPGGGRRDSPQGAGVDVAQDPNAMQEASLETLFRLRQGMLDSSPILAKRVTDSFRVGAHAHVHSSGQRGTTSRRPGRLSAR